MARVFVTNHKTVSTEGLIPNYFCFALPRLVIGSENSRHFLYPSVSKLKPIATWSPAFSRAWGRLCVFHLSSYWHFPFVQVVAVITLSLVLRHYSEIGSKQNNGIPDDFWHAIEKNWQALCLSSLSATSKQEGETFKTWYALLETDGSLKRFKDALTSLASVMRWIKLAHEVKWT